jgi:uncharacterized phage protein gp47/JayE
MPLTIVPKDQILANEVSYVLAGNIANDINTISVLRQILEADSASLADLYYALYTTVQGWYVSTAEGIDLDIRGRDYGLARDVGQAASDPITYTPLSTWTDDIALPAPQVVQAILADGTQVLYHSLGDLVLTPSGRSISGQAPATSLTGGTNDRLTLNLDSDGQQTLILGTQTTGVGIAAAIQAAVRALTAVNPSKQQAYTGFRCDYSVTTAGAYTLRSGSAGISTAVVVTVAASLDASHDLKLGLTQGGQELVGQGSLAVPVVCDQIGIIGNVGVGQINTQVSPVTGIDHVANSLAFSNGREPASDDSYRQDLRSYLLALGRGTRDAIERAVMHTILPSDGQQHVMSSQVVYGASTIQAYVCDGRSLTVGAQSDIIEAVQDELDGLGQELGGWVPGGNAAGVTSAAVLGINVAVEITVGTTPDMVRAQQVISTVIYNQLYQSGVGQSMSYSQISRAIDAAVVEVFDIQFTQPIEWSGATPIVVGGQIGQKLMPGTIAVTVVRA